MRIVVRQLPVCCGKHICMYSHHRPPTKELGTSSWPHVTTAITHRPTGAICQGSPLKWMSHKVTYHAISSHHHHCCFSTIAQDMAGQSWHQLYGWALNGWHKAVPWLTVHLICLEWIFWMFKGAYEYVLKAVSPVTLQPRRLDICRIWGLVDKGRVFK